MFKKNKKAIFQAGFISLLFALLSCGHGEGVHPEVKSLTEAVYASGYVVARGEYEVYAQAEGYLISKLVEDGDEVKDGDVMFVIDADQQSAQYRIARENYQVAQENYSKGSAVLAELEAATEAARTKMEFDSVNYERYKNLLKENAIARAEHDRAKLAFENSKSEYQLQKSRLEKTRTQLRLELVNARNQLSIAGDENKRYTIRSRVNGMVFKTNRDEGEMIRRGELVAVVGRKNNFYLELQVDELDVDRVKKGQPVLVKIDAYPGKVFNAEVSQVYPMIDKQQQSVQVDAILRDSLTGWFSGLALEANIVIRRKEKAMVIPKVALLRGDSVRVATDDGEKKVKVKTGIETLDEVEIVEGLDVEDRLVLNR